MMMVMTRMIIHVQWFGRDV